MHHGMVAANASADRLIAAMNLHLPSLIPGQTIGSFDRPQP
jgi:hypothetical protein